MYTSCGWFFDEVSGLEAVQILRYAARVIQLARELGGDADLEAAFLKRLQAVPSNVAELRNGEGVYQRHVQPAVVDLRRVIAHYAVTSPYELYGDAARVYAYTVERLAWQRESFKETSLMLGRVRVTADVMGETEEATVAVLHFGGHDFHCAVRSEVDPAGFDRLATELFRRFGRHSLAEVVRALDEQVDARSYGIRDVFLEERRRLLTHVTEGVRQGLEETYRRVYAENRRLMEYLREVDAPQPEALAVAARYVLQRAIERELSALDGDDAILACAVRVGGLLAQARALGIEPRIERDPTAAHLERALLRCVERIRAGVAGASLEEALAVLQLGRQLGVTPSLWAAQNRFFELWNGRRSASAGGALLAPLALALGFAPDAQ
jgi:hypothetical protein